MFSQRKTPGAAAVAISSATRRVILSDAYRHWVFILLPLLHMPRIRSWSRCETVPLSESWQLRKYSPASLTQHHAKPYLAALRLAGLAARRSIWSDRSVPMVRRIHDKSGVFSNRSSLGSHTNAPKQHRSGSSCCSVSKSRRYRLLLPYIESVNPNTQTKILKTTMARLRRLRPDHRGWG